MPEYDLGTAHGRIRLDADTRGAKTAERALESFERAIALIDKRLDQFERKLDSMERELLSTSRAFDEASGSARDYGDSVDHAGTRTRETTTHTKRFNRELDTMGTLLLQNRQRLQSMIGPMAMLYRTWQGMQGGKSFLSSFAGNGGGSAALLSHLTATFLGLGAAMATVSQRQRTLFGHAGRWQAFAAGITVVGGLERKFHLFDRTMRLFVGDTIAGDHAILGMRDSIERTSRPLRRLYLMLNEVSRGIIGIVGGRALMRHGMARLGQQFGFLTNMSLKMKLAIGGIFVALQAGVQFASRALVVLSNTFVALLSIIRQVSGAALAIPGAIMTAVTAAGVLKTIFSGLKKIFADVLNAETTEDFEAAIITVPEKFRDLGRALYDVKNKLLEVREGFVDTFLQGAQGQVEALSNTYLPLLSKQGRVVANEFTEMKNRLADFLTQNDTVRDLGLIFGYTSDTLDNVNEALQPFLTGMRDIATVGRVENISTRYTTVSNESVLECF